MHILTTTSATLDDLAEPVDLKQPPADIVALSFTDSDLASLAAAHRLAGSDAPSLQLTPLRELRHPMSVDLWIDSMAGQAKIVLVRILGGYEWWRYGCDRLAAMAREKGFHLALLPGECREMDERLIEASTLPRATLDELLAYFREGGSANMQGLLGRLGALAGHESLAVQPASVPKAGFYLPGRGIATVGDMRATLTPGAPIVPLLFYRSMLLAADIAPIDALCAELAAHRISAVPIFVASLKESASLDFVEQAVTDFPPDILVTTTAFASGAEPGTETLFDRIGVPVLQAIIATTRHEAWSTNQRGLAPADLAMHVVLPELDGRIHAGAIAFKAEALESAGHRGMINQPEPARVVQFARRVENLVRLRRTERAKRNILILIPDYPAAPGRTGYAVGLDVPASVLAMLHDLQQAGYCVGHIPATPRALLDALDRGQHALPLTAYTKAFSDIPEAARQAVEDAWGSAVHADLADNISFRAARFGNITVALAPDRGRSIDRRVDYHDPTIPPRHELLAFGIWLQNTLDCHAIIHVGAHGTLEWLPGKTVALSHACFPEIVTGALPVIYPFIVSNPGEAAQAKRRIAAVTLGHLPPPLTEAGLDENQQILERLVDEFAQAEGLDRRRRDRLAKLIVEKARETGLALDAGMSGSETPDEALQRIDAWLCDLKDFAIKDGLHIYGRVQDDDPEPMRHESAQYERRSLLAALDGRHITAGPSGAPARGRTDVLPTGRNLFTADPRTMPTPTAFELGRAAAEEVLRRYLQDHGDWPKSLVIDLWGSASLRTGGEEIAQGLYLMGCRPQWDAATGRVTAVEVLPAAMMGRPRIDVTWRISGLFRDMFPSQIALIHAAAMAVGARDEDADENPLSALAKVQGSVPSRVFGSSPGTYGAGIEERLASGDWADREELGRAYLDAGSHSYGGAEGEGTSAPGAFADRVASAELLIHTGDDPGRDILEGSADVAFIGGFSAAIAVLGGKADIIALDTTDPARPRARSVSEAVARVVRARATNPVFIAGQLRHGPRGASEFTETVDRLIGFAETTNAIAPSLIEAVYDAYLGDPQVRAFLLAENPAAARAIAVRFASARKRGLWHPLRNSVDNDLAELIAEATGRLAA
ncbi:cobaltochelatase subunit CobN [Mesorhizobium sp. NBSH29]|uniref:cobaltochelatase subunit CobN n=1 Tax=Mesorhizobium sp. NBSH29 TaxID=2654249 RepID=UPI0018967F50|nr:cobaltochelatase subunit CobN [Mesorhizobium sp. NBSH29]QPC86647.1 cobaltochelatase subunit CobN [Mesorhizobium sp. NBSH29]